MKHRSPFLWAIASLTLLLVSTPAPSQISVPIQQGSVTNGDVAVWACTGSSCNLIKDGGGAPLTPSSTQVGLVNIQTFCASGCTTTSLPATYTPTAGTHAIVVEVQAQGGGAGGCASTSGVQNCIAGSGGAGSYGRSYFTTGFTGSTITVAATGAGGSAGANPGTAGGTASFGSAISCPGGTAGVPGAAFTSTTSTLSTGGVPAAACTFSGGIQIDSIPGSGAGFGLSLGFLAGNFSAGGANSTKGAGAPYSTNEANGQNATGFGSGGSGGASSNGAATAGGNPSPGIVIVWEYR